MVRRMSPYERRRRGNARRSGGTHRSSAGNTTPGQRDSGHLAVPGDIRTQNRNTSRREAGTNRQANRSRGAYASWRLNLSRHWEGLWAISQGQNRTRESRPSGIAGGSWETWQMAELGTHAADPKGRTWSLFAFLCARPGSTRQGVPAWTPRAREPSPRLRARLRCPRNLPDYLPGLRARALGEVGSPRDEPAAGNLHGGVCEGGVPRCRHGGPKRARSRKRWIGPRNTYSIRRSPLLGNTTPTILRKKIEDNSLWAQSASAGVRSVSGSIRKVRLVLQTRQP